MLTQQPDFQTARKYWNKLKERLGKEGSQLVTNCHRFKLLADDGKLRLTDVANAETLLRLVQSVPSPKAEPIKLWLAKVGYERMQEMADPALALERARETWQKHGRSEKWIQQRMTGQETRNKLTDYWATHDIKQGDEYYEPGAAESPRGSGSHLIGGSRTARILPLRLGRQIECQAWLDQPQSPAAPRGLATQCVAQDRGDIERWADELDKL